jgi:hypothetical protein
MVPSENLFLTPEARVDVGTAGTMVNSTYAAACFGRYVYAVWADTPNGKYDIFFNRSLDGGATWQPVQARLDSGSAGAANSVDPKICCSGSRVYVCWLDDRSGHRQVYMAWSVDYGATWGHDVRVDRNPTAKDCDNHAICCDEGNVYVAWTDRRNGDQDDAFANASHDSGATWLSNDRRIDSDISGDGVVTGLSLACSGLRVCAVWQDLRNGLPDIYFNRSLNGGTTWSGSDVRLDTDLAGTGASMAPQLVVSGTTVGVAWLDSRPGQSGLYFNRSEDWGGLWQANDVRLNHPPATSGVAYPRICSTGSTFYVAWMDNRSGQNDLYVNRSDDNGATWLADDVRVDTDVPAVGSSQELVLACAGVDVYVAWREFRSLLGDAYFSVSHDRGATWLPRDLPANSVSGGIWTPSVVASEKAVCVLWAQGVGDLHLASRRWGY